MGRDHRHLGIPYIECFKCGFIIRKNKSILRNGRRWCPDCLDEGPYSPPPFKGWITNRQKPITEFGILTYLEEMGMRGGFAVNSEASAEYGEVTRFDRVLTSNLSGEYGTVTYLPDYRV